MGTPSTCRTSATLAQDQAVQPDLMLVRNRRQGGWVLEELERIGARVEDVRHCDPARDGADQAPDAHGPGLQA